MLPELVRTEEMVGDANSKLALPADQFRYAQFWFVNATPVENASSSEELIDGIAFDYLIKGNVDNALSMWEMKETASSLQNLFVLHMIRENHSEAMACAEKLYAFHKNEFVSMVMWQTPTISTDRIEYDFLDGLCSGMEADKYQPYIKNEDWKRYVTERFLKILSSVLKKAIDDSKAVNGKSPEARYYAGKTLMEVSKKLLGQLKTLLGESDSRYRNNADGVASAIHKCVIDYFNGEHTGEAAKRSMKLMEYAVSVATGDFTMGKCKKIYEQLQKIIGVEPTKTKKPEQERLPEIAAIENIFEKYCNKPETVSNSKALLEETKTYLQILKVTLGSANPLYLELSTKVVRKALNNAIFEFDMLCVAYTASSVTSFQNNVLSLMNIMDDFDLEEGYKSLYRDTCYMLKTRIEKLSYNVKSNEHKNDAKKRARIVQTTADGTADRQTADIPADQRTAYRPRGDRLRTVVIIVAVLLAILLFYLMLRVYS